MLHGCLLCSSGRLVFPPKSGISRWDPQLTSIFAIILYTKCRFGILTIRRGFGVLIGRLCAAECKRYSRTGIRRRCRINGCTILLPMHGKSRPICTSRPTLGYVSVSSVISGKWKKLCFVDFHPRYFEILRSSRNTRRPNKLLSNFTKEICEC